VVGDLVDISELTDQSIKHMVLNKTGVQPILGAIAVIAA
jgi:hypothetical protein